VLRKLFGHRQKPADTEGIGLFLRGVLAFQLGQVEQLTDVTWGSASLDQRKVLLDWTVGLVEGCLLPANIQLKDVDAVSLSAVVGSAFPETAGPPVAMGIAGALMQASQGVLDTTNARQLGQRCGDELMRTAAYEGQQAVETRLSGSAADLVMAVAGAACS
jgi:hypothetical protein